jgi:aryl-alcohol dehydrogenase-like predicted oxidoreductase
VNWSKVVYGAAKIHNLSPDKSYELVSKIHGLGCREIDTAPSYDKSETLLGSFLEEFPDFKVNTKVGTNQSNQFTSTSIKESVYKSLESLKISRINILFIHSVPSHLITDDVLMSLRELKAENICNSIGYSGDGIDLKSEISRRAQNHDAFMLSYNFLDQANKEITESHISQKNIYLKLFKI